MPSPKHILAPASQFTRSQTQKVLRKNPGHMETNTARVYAALGPILNRLIRALTAAAHQVGEEAGPAHFLEEETEVQTQM